MCFSENEMIDLLKQVRTKKEKNPIGFLDLPLIQKNKYLEQGD